jgi:hypothetical protein
MLIPSLLILLLSVAPFAHCYTVITRTGKRVEGTLISEQTSTVLIKDSQGILISFKSETLDWKAMQLANVPRPIEQESKPAVSSVRKEVSLTEIARRTREQRSGKARVFTLDDLRRAPELSVMGSDLQVSPKRNEDAMPDESRWTSRLVALKKEVNRLRERKVSADAACQESKRKQFEVRTTGHDRPSNLLQTYKETAQCLKLREIDRQLEDAERRLDDAREEGRRAGVSWQALE